MLPTWGEMMQLSRAQSGRLVRQRLGIGHVEDRTCDLTGDQRPVQSVVVDVSAPSRVDEPGVVTHGSQGFVVDDVGRLGRERQRHHHQIGGAECLGELSGGEGA